MDFLDKLTKKASETYKGAAEKTSKFARETKLKMKINENKSKIDDLYEEIGKKVYQKHVAEEELDIKSDLELECGKIDELSREIDEFHKEIVTLSNGKICESCKQEMDKEAKFCPKCGAEQPEIEVEVPETKEDKKDDEAIEVEFIPDEKIEQTEGTEETENKKEDEE